MELLSKAEDRLPLEDLPCISRTNYRLDVFRCCNRLKIDIMELKKRKGKVALSLDVLHSMDLDHLSTLFGSFFPFHIDNNGTDFSGVITYFGKSMYFDEIEEGEEIPTYEPQIEKSVQYGIFSIDFIKVSDTSL